MIGVLLLVLTAVFPVLLYLVFKVMARRAFPMDVPSPPAPAVDEVEGGDDDVVPEE